MAEVEFQYQQRRSLALQITPEGLVALLPLGLDPGSPQVQAFLQQGLDDLPHPELVPPPERLTVEDIHTVVKAWAERIGVEVGRVQVRAMRRKWASCSSRGTLTLSDDLLHLPRDLVEYVVCHELLHLRVPEHGKGWQALMGAYLPDWRERERRLAGWAVA